jgi:hypothetical protein
MSAPVMAAGAVAVQVAANAIKACGVLVRLEPAAFEQLLRRTERPLSMSVGVVHPSSLRHAVRGLTFHCKSPTPVELPTTVELIDAVRCPSPISDVVGSAIWCRSQMAELTAVRLAPCRFRIWCRSQSGGTGPR